jgi:arylsulfatase A-like enzyme
MAYIAADNIAPGDRGTRSSFDVVPTLFDLLGERLPPNISGHSLLDAEQGRESEDVSAFVSQRNIEVRPNLF